MTSITGLLKDVRGVTFAGIVYETKVNTAATSPLRGLICKRTKTTVTLANHLKDMTSLYLNKVKKTGEVEDFKLSEAHFTHTNCHSVVQSKDFPENFYLYALMNDKKNAVSKYFRTDTGEELTSDEVAKELTPSALRDFLKPQADVYNAKNDVVHSAHVRTFKLESIKELVANKQHVTGPFYA